MRAGDVMQAGLVFAGERRRWRCPAFAAINVVLTGGWLAVARGLNTAPDGADEATAGSW